MKRIKTLSLVFFGIAAIAAPFFAVHFYSAETITHNYTSESPYQLALPDVLAIPQFTLPLSIPAYWYGFPHNEIWMIKTSTDWTAGCSVSPELNELDDCLVTLYSTIEGVRGRPEITSEAFQPIFFNHKGYKLIVDDKAINLNINPKIRANHEKSLKLVERYVLSRHFAKSNMEEIFLKIHKTLLEGLPGHAQGGHYRTKIAFVQPEDKASNREYLANIIRQAKGERAVKLYNGIMFRLSLDDDENQSLLASLTHEEQEVLNLVFYIPPSPNILLDQMQKFIQKYRLLIEKNDMHPIARAAWVHMELIHIHPFEDGNGRFARMIMNAELMRGGYNPCIFFNDKAYAEAIYEDSQAPGSFASFLKKSCEETEPLVYRSSFPDFV